MPNPIETKLVTREILVGDLDGQNFDDLVQASENGVLVYLSTGPGQFGEPITYGTSEIRRAILVDLDGDSDLDIAAVDFDINQVSIFLSNGNGTFQDPVVVAALGSGSVQSLAAGDFDMDGDTDLVVSKTFFFAADPLGEIVVLTNLGNHTFQSTIYEVDMFLNEGLATADMDNDGDIDVIAAGSSTNSGQLVTFFNNGFGNFSQQNSTPSQGSFAPKNISTGDLDGDSDIDVVASRIVLGDLIVQNDELELFFNNGDGTHVSGPIYELGERPGSIITVDLDDDGNNEVVVNLWTGESFGVLSNLGRPDFNQTNYPTIDRPLIAAVGNLDGQEDEDVVIVTLSVSSGLRTVTYYLSDCGVLIGDVNQDGSIDLLDVAPFVHFVITVDYQIEADIDQNGIVDLEDIFPFVELLVN